jgi:hypothetical protein
LHSSKARRWSESSNTTKSGAGHTSTSNL